MDLNLNPEEIQKINNLWKTSRFQRSWRSVQNIVNCKDSVTNYFVRNIILIFISIIVENISVASLTTSLHSFAMPALS